MIYLMDAPRVEYDFDKKDKKTEEVIDGNSYEGNLSEIL